jgi:hypothetical protein
MTLTNLLINLILKTMKKFLLFTGIMLIFGLTVFNSCKKDDAPPTWEELLTGGPSATNGKTWVLSGKNYATEDGAGVISPMMASIMGFPDSVLVANRLGVEYDNEFTFFSDGKYVMNPVNGKVLSGIIFATMTGVLVPWTESALGLCAANFTPPASSTWTLNSTDMVVENAISDPTTTALPPVRSNVTFTGVKWLSFSTGAFLGILDYPTTAKVIIKDITEDKMHIALLLCGYAMTADPSGNGLQYANSPTWLVQFTLVPKGN